MKSQKRVWILASIFCAVSIAGFVLVQMNLDKSLSSRDQLKEKLIYIPEGRFLKTAVMGFDAAIADVLWARTVVYFGGHFVTDKDYRWLYSLLDATTTLDPKNILAYRFGGSLLALESDNVQESIAILKKGIKNNPDEDWRLYFLLGFNYFYSLEDYSTAAKYLRKASTMPGHPGYLPRLAAKMYAKDGKLDSAIEFLEETYRQYDDENIKSVISERLNVLIAKKQARSLSPVVEKYKEIYGKYPEEINALVRAGLVSGIPVYPDGHYVIDPDSGAVDWVSESIPHWP